MADEQKREYKIGETIETFTAYDKKSGEVVVCDDRTFNPKKHSKTAPKPAGGASGSGGSTGSGASGS